MTVVRSTRKFFTASLTKLTCDNYRIWILKTQGILKAHRIMGIVDGSVSRPATAGKDRDNWVTCDIEAYTAMELTMGV